MSVDGILGGVCGRSDGGEVGGETCWGGWWGGLGERRGALSLVGKSLDPSAWCIEGVLVLPDVPLQCSQVQFG